MENNSEHEMEALGFSSKGDITFWKHRNLIQDRAMHNRRHHNKADVVTTSNDVDVHSEPM